MGGRVAPTSFPQPGAIGSSQQASNAVLNPSATPQAAAKLNPFDPASVLPTNTPAPQAPPPDNPLTLASNRRNPAGAFDGAGTYRNRISMMSNY